MTVDEDEEKSSSAAHDMNEDCSPKMQMKIGSDRFP
jgi:hypothetical protein